MRFHVSDSKNQKEKQGFTLIELSIVLVIIGLLVGGTLVGLDLIAAAKIRSGGAQIQKYETVVNTFKLKYGQKCLPGDCLKLRDLGFSHRWGGSPGLGDTNRLLQHRYQSTNYSPYIYGDEFVLFWNDLIRAELIDEALDATISYLNWSCANADRPRCYPKSKLTDDYLFIYNRDAYNYYLIGQSSIYNDILPTAVLSPMQANAYDSKFDDGLPLSGRVQSLKVGTYYAVPDTSSANSCINTNTTYNVVGSYADQKLCSISIRTGFN